MLLLSAFWNTGTSLMGLSRLSPRSLWTSARASSPSDLDFLNLRSQSLLTLWSPSSLNPACMLVVSQVSRPKCISLYNSRFSLAPRKFSGPTLGFLTLEGNCDFCLGHVISPNFVSNPAWPAAMSSQETTDSLRDEVAAITQEFIQVQTLLEWHKCELIIQRLNDEAASSWALLGYLIVS